MANLRQVKFFKQYFLDFYTSLNTRVQEKIDYLLDVLATQPFVPSKYVKYIENSDGIYELRISISTNEYRILFFFESGSLIDGGKVVILGNGFIKKDRKDYKKAVEKAEAIKRDYFKENKI